MTNALDLALANAAANAPKGEELHLENLDSIADPTQDEFVSFDAELKRTTLNRSNPDHYRDVVVPEPPQYDPRDVAFKPHVFSVNDPRQDALLYAAIRTVDAKVAALTDHIVELKVTTHMISTTITTAAQSMPNEPDLKHRSLEDWPLTTLINELVERENDLMPFYYELLKRIGSPDLQKLVMSSMQGKNSSMVVLAQLCAAMGSMSAPQPQAQQRPVDHTLADIYKQIEDSLPPHNKFSRQHREDAIALVEQYKLSIEQRNALSDHDFKAYQSFMNELLHRATLMERIPNRELQPIAEAEPQRLEQMSPLEQQNFAQQMNTVVPKSSYFEAPPTYNPYFKER